MADEPDLHPNTSSEWVAYLQQCLNAAGFPSPSDGSFDESTLDALHQFQHHYGLPLTDHVDQATWRPLLVAAGVEAPNQSTPEGHAAHGTDPAGEDTGPWPGVETVKIWMKAFIPGDAPGTIDGVGASSGHRLLHGPVSWFNDCFYTDSRGFSNNIGADARMHSEIVININTGAVESEVHYCGQTIEADCEDGDHECVATASTSGMAFSNLTHHGNVITVDLNGAAGNPCFSGAPDIDYVGTYTIDLRAHTVHFEGMVNGFPAYESYATTNHGAGVTIFTYGPRGTPSDLFGGATDAVSGTAHL